MLACDCAELLGPLVPTSPPVRQRLRSVKFRVRIVDVTLNVCRVFGHENLLVRRLESGSATESRNGLFWLVNGDVLQDELMSGNVRHCNTLQMLGLDVIADQPSRVGVFVRSRLHHGAELVVVR